MRDEALKLALEALEHIANETYDSWTNGADAGRIAQTTLSKIKNKCRAIQTSDQMTCECGNIWDMNDPYPPKCTALREALAEQREVKDVVIDNMGDPFIVKAYVTPQPAQQEPVAKYIGEGSEGSLVQLYDDVKKGADFYTSPPTQRTWVGLTDAHVEMIAAWLETQMIETPTTGPHLANALRYVGAKLKEKNT